MGSSSEMTAFVAFRDGLRRVNGAPLVLFGAVGLTLLLALPLSVALRGMLEAHLGRSAAAEAVAEGADHDWWEEFTAQASGLGTTFTPSIIGFAAVLKNTGGLLDNRPLAATITGVTVAWLLLWSFLSGGVLDRYARQRPTRAHGFFAACGTHFWRFLRLGIVAGFVYVVLFGTVHDSIFGTGYGRFSRDLTSERTAFVIRVGAYGVFSALLASFALLFDFARVRIVVEDRRSAFGALVGSGRFIARHLRQVCGLFALNGVVFVTLIAVYGVLSPGAPRAGTQMVLALALGQAYIIGRHYLKLLVYASETSLFQGVLAHASYSAAPEVIWPDSPAVETIINAGPTGSR
jgi:hypothetical protein